MNAILASNNTSVVILLDDCDMDLVGKIKVDRRGQAFVGVHASRRRVASLLAERMLGRSLLLNERICFKNRNHHDLRRENIIVTGVSARTRYAGPQKHSSVFKGVSWQPSRFKWYAQIYGVDGVAKNLGRFDREEDAAEAYNKAVTQLNVAVAFINDISP